MHTKKESNRGKLLNQFVRARVTMLDGIDLSIFDFDRHNTLYYFILNSHGHIYLRYGGRTSTDGEKYLNLDSLQLALKQGLELYKNAPDSGSHKARPFTLTPESITSVNAEVVKKGRCVECHIVEDFIAKEKIAADLFEPLKDLYQYPDIEKLGLELNIPKGLVIGSVEGPAAIAGIQVGDTITHLGRSKVYTFGDLQYAYNKLERTASIVTVEVKRGDVSHSCNITLPNKWWKTAINFRHWSIQPRVNFYGDELSSQDKEKYKLPANSFAERVTSTDLNAIISNLHELKKEDIIYSVNSVESDTFAGDLVTHFNLNYSAGDSVELGVIREEKRIEIPLKTSSLRFRKVKKNEMFTLTHITWSEPQKVLHDGAMCLSVRGTTANGYLILEVTYAAGWIANWQSDFKANFPFTPTIIFSTPNDSEFREKSYLAIELKDSPEPTIPVSLKGAIKKATSLQEISLQLEIPSKTHRVQNAAIQLLLTELEPAVNE